MTSVSHAVVNARPARCELVAQLDVVVDLAVLRDGDRAAVDRDRLMAAGDVDDAQARRAERRRSVDEQAAVVRAAVAQRRDHRATSRGPDRRPPFSETKPAIPHMGRRDSMRPPRRPPSSSATNAATRSADAAVEELALLGGPRAPALASSDGSSR